MLKRILLIILSLFILVEFALAEGGGLSIKRSNPVSFERERGTVTFNVSLFADPAILMSFLTSDKIIWKVFKPGVYVTDGIVFGVVTNMRTQITFSGVEDLQSEDRASSIPTWYAIQEEGPGWLPATGNDVAFGEKIDKLTSQYNLTWLSANELNNHTITIQPGQDQVKTKIMHIWNKIKVDWDVEPKIYCDPNGCWITITQVP